MKRIIAIITGTILLISTTLVLIRCNVGRDAYQELIEVREKLHIGMTREETEAFTSAAASHRLCDYNELGLSIYFFGQGDDIALLLRFSKEDDQEILLDISEPEPYQLESEPYVSCQPVIPH